MAFGIFQHVAQGYVCILGSGTLQLCLRANPDPETLSSAEEDALRLVSHEQSSYWDQSISVLWLTEVRTSFGISFSPWTCPEAWTHLIHLQGPA